MKILIGHRNGEPKALEVLADEEERILSAAEYYAANGYRLRIAEMDIKRYGIVSPYQREQMRKSAWKLAR
jgi:hypothetical protein